MKITIITACMFSCTTLTFADPLPTFVPSFSLVEAETQAISNEPRLLEAEALLDATAENIKAAASLEAPNLMLRMANLPVDSFNLSQEAMTQAVVGVSQAFPSGDTRELREEKSRKLKGIEQAKFELIKADTLRSVRLAWLDVWMSREAMVLLEEQNKVLHTLQPTLEKAYAAGRATQGMVEKVRMRLARLQGARLKEEGKQDEAVQQMSRWFDAPSSAIWAENLPDLLKQIPEGSIAHHPQLQIDKAMSDVKNVETDLLKQAYKSRWVGDVSYGWRDGRADFISVGVKVSLPSVVAKRNDSRIAAANAQFKASQQAQNVRLITLETKSARLRSAANSLAAQISSYDEDLLPSLQRLKRLSESEYRAGTGSAASVLETTQDLIQAQSERLELLQKRTEDIIELLWLTEELS